MALQSCVLKVEVVEAIQSRYSSKKAIFTERLDYPLYEIGSTCGIVLE